MALFSKKKEKWKILVVDNEPSLAELIRINLPSDRFISLKAIGGMEAVKKSRRERPDLIILDLMMPEMDGWQVLEVLQQDKNTKDIPVIVCSAAGGREDIGRAKALGAREHVVKPINMQELVKKCEALLGGRR